MEGTCHEWVIIRSIAENNELSATQRTIILGSLSCILDDFAQQAYSIHIDTGLGRTYVYRAADEIGLSHSLRDRTDEELIALAHTLAYDGRVSTEEVDTQLLGTLVESLGNLHIVIGSLAGRAAHECDRSDGDALVYDRHTILFRDVLTSLHQILGEAGNLIINVLTELVEI